MIDLAKWIRDLAGSTSDTAFIPRPEDDPMVRQPDITLAKKELGRSPQVSIEDGLKRTISWFGEHPELRMPQVDIRAQQGAGMSS